MKTYVLIISKIFPKTHPKAGEETFFTELIKKGEKIHTIRKNYQLWKNRLLEVKKGEAIISLRTWIAAPYRSKQIEIKQISKEDNPNAQHVFITKSWMGYQASVSGREIFGGIERESLAKNDGLKVYDFADWFFPKEKDNEFSGVIIHFTSFRYEKD